MQIDAYRSNERIDLMLKDLETLHIQIDVTKAYQAAQIIKRSILKSVKTADVIDDDQVSGGFVGVTSDVSKAGCDCYHRTSDNTWLVYVSFYRSETAIRFFFNDDVSHFTVIPVRVSPANDAYEYYSLVDRGFNPA